MTGDLKVFYRLIRLSLPIVDRSKFFMVSTRLNLPIVDCSSVSVIRVFSTFIAIYESSQFLRFRCLIVLIWLSETFDIDRNLIRYVDIVFGLASGEESMVRGL